jgi:hypothetical protein
LHSENIFIPDWPLKAKEKWDYLGENGEIPDFSCKSKLNGWHPSVFRRVVFVD